MIQEPARTVFDCNVYFQALISAEGPAAQRLIAAARGEVVLYCSEATLTELTDVAGRHAIRQRFRLTDERVETFLQTIREITTLVDVIPELYTHPVDPDDSHYVNLAVACRADFLVSRDKDLLRLMDPAQPDGRRFHEHFPFIQIVSPELLLQEIERLRRQSGRPE